MPKLPLALLLLIAVAPVTAAAASLNLTNNSGESINAATAIPRGATIDPGAPPPNLLPAPIPNGEPGDITLEAAEGACLFDLSFTLDSGRVIDAPNTDICQIDTIVVE